MLSDGAAEEGATGEAGDAAVVDVAGSFVAAYVAVERLLTRAAATRLAADAWVIQVICQIEL